MSENRLLPARLYHDPAVLEAEQQAVFERSWQVIGHVSDLPEPGSYIAVKVGRYEVMVVRGEGGEIHGVRNACRHRGAVLGEGRGAFKTKGIRCPYHGWTYKYDGSFPAAPEARSFDCLDRSGLGLPKIQVGTLMGLVFVNLDLAATPLAEQLAGLEELAGRYLAGPLGQFGPGYGVHAWNPKWDQGSNWKVLIDNYLEGMFRPLTLDWPVSTSTSATPPPPIPVSRSLRRRCVTSLRATESSGSTRSWYAPCLALMRRTRGSGGMRRSTRTSCSTSTRTRSTCGGWCPRPLTPAISAWPSTAPRAPGRAPRPCSG